MYAVHWELAVHVFVNTANMTPNTANMTPNTANMTTNTANMTPNTANMTPNTANMTPNTAVNLGTILVSRTKCHEVCSWHNYQQHYSQQHA